MPSTVTVHYPFHPLHCRCLEVVAWPRQPHLAVTVRQPDGQTLKIPLWMVEPAAAHCELRDRVELTAGVPHALIALLGDAFVECEVLDRYALEVGTTVEGPAVIEERESTCVLGPGDRATVDAHLNLAAELANEEHVVRRDRRLEAWASSRLRLCQRRPRETREPRPDRR